MPRATKRLPVYRSRYNDMKRTACTVLTWLTIGTHRATLFSASPSPNRDMDSGLAGGVGGESTRCDMIAVTRRSSAFTVKASAILD